MNRITWVLALAMVVIVSQMSIAAPCCEKACCDEVAGCDDGQCQLVTETAKVTKHCWNVEEKQICKVKPGRMKLDFGPLCSEIGNLLSFGGKCKKKNACNTCDEVEACEKVEACAPACAPQPKCGRPITVKKLVIKKYTVEKQVYRCQPTDCGPECCEAPETCKAIRACAPAPIKTPAEAQPAAPLPPPTAGLQYLRQ